MHNFKNGWAFEIIETEEDSVDTYKQFFYQSSYKTESLSHVPSHVATIKSENAKKLESKAYTLYYQNNYAEAEKLYKQVIEAYGQNNSESLECAYILANIYEKQCKYKEAEELYEQTYKRVKDLNDKQSLCQLIVDRLATLYEKFGKTEEAESLLMKVIFYNSDASLYQDVQYVENCIKHLLNVYSKTCEFAKEFELKKRLSALKSHHFGYSI